MTGRFARHLATLLALGTLAATPAHAVFRAYLSLDGSDANPCTLPLPCRLLPAALAVVDPGGEIWMLDSANYNTGTVDIAKSVTILAVPGVLGSVVANGGDAISLATAGAKVALRNVNIRPLAGNENRRGIWMQAPGELSLQGCDVSGFSTGVGVLAGTFSAVTAARLTVIGSTLRNNAIGLYLLDGPTAVVTQSHFRDGATAGVTVTTTRVGVTTTGVVDASTAFNVATGFQAIAPVDGGEAHLAVTRSAVHATTTAGIDSTSIAGGGIVRVAVNDSLLAGNVTGLRIHQTRARLLWMGNTLVDNGTGVLATAAAAFRSSGTNTVTANVTDVDSTLLFPADVF